MSYKDKLINLLDTYETEHNLLGVVWEFCYKFMDTYLKGMH